MSRHIHLCLSIRGAISGTGWKFISSPDGRKVKKAEAIEYLMDRLAEGKKVLPIGECDGFSFQTGCPGHEEPEAGDATNAAPCPIALPDLADAAEVARGAKTLASQNSESSQTPSLVAAQAASEQQGGTRGLSKIATAERRGGGPGTAGAPDDPCEAKGADSPAGGLSASPAKSALDLAATGDGRNGEEPTRTLTDETGTAGGAGPAAPTLDCASEDAARATGARGQKAVTKTVAAETLDLGAAGNQGAPLRKRGDGATPETTPAGPAAPETTPRAVKAEEGRPPSRPGQTLAAKRLDIRLVGADGVETPLEVGSP